MKNTFLIPNLRTKMVEQAQVLVGSIKFDYEQALSSDMESNLPKSLKNKIKKRKVEFLAGRCCASVCLQKAKAEPAVVGRLDCGRPLWPSGFVGSITHTNQLAMSAVASSCDFLGIGIDAEKVIDLGRITKIKKKIVTDDEFHSLCKEATVPEELVFSLVFSAKESIYKAMNPRTESWLGFLDAVISEIDWKQQSYKVEIKKEDYKGKLNSYWGEFEIQGPYVITYFYWLT